MSSGYLEFVLPNIHVVAIFTNGRIYEGKCKISNVLYEGTFNENSLLHGKNCSMKIDNISYNGEFENGQLINGKGFIDNKIIECGEYVHKISKKPHLKRGKKYNNDLIYDGIYDNSGYLIEGTCICDTTIYEGKFNNNKLIDGSVTYLIKDKIFIARYVVKYDYELHRDIFSKCETKWDGQLEILPRKLLMMVCCNSKNSELAHKFFIKYLMKFDSSSIRFLHKKMFSREQLSPESEAGLMLILENLTKYQDYTGENLADISVSNRSTSFSNIKGNELLIDAINEYHNIDY